MTATGAAPRFSAPAYDYTQRDAESLRLELVRKVLAGDPLDRFHELNVYRREEPDIIRLEGSQIRRAMSTPDFVLVVVSGIERADARPKVRIIVDPLHQLRMTETSSVSLAGVRSAEHSLVYDLLPLPDGDGDGDV